MAEIGYKLRHECERKIASQCINDLHDAGYGITVNGGEEDTVVNSLDHNEVLNAMFTTDEDWLYAVDPKTGIQQGWVRFIYGNDGPDVINDYTINLDTVLARTMELADREEERLYGN
jgi:hypothetical protein